MTAQPFTLTLPRWLIAMVLALSSATLPIYLGHTLHRNSLEKTLTNRIEQAIGVAIEELDVLLDQLSAVVPSVEPLATQDCEAPVIQQLQHLAILHAYLRSAFIARDNQHVCGSFFGNSSHPLELPLPGAGYLTLYAADPLTPSASSVVYSFPHTPYTINLTAYGETLAEPLRRSGRDIQVFLGVGDAQMDETSRVWGTDQTQALMLHRTRLSERHPYLVHGGVYPHDIESQQEEGLKAMIGSLLVSSTLIGGVVFTVAFNVGRRRR